MTENFKGIEFIRISSLPEDQKEKIWQSFQHDKIIKIVKDQALLNDCILVHDYVSWLGQQQSAVIQSNSPTPSVATMPLFSKLAFK